MICWRWLRGEDRHRLKLEIWDTHSLSSGTLTPTAPGLGKLGLGTLTLPVGA